MRVLRLKIVPIVVDERRKFRDRARELRREETAAERKLWLRLRNRDLLGVKFRRQRPIGKFIADFVCLEHRIVVEPDGGHHGERHVEAYDGRRTAYLTSKGFKVFRFSNAEVYENLEGVLDLKQAH